jgi:hypothetical protein
VPLRWLQDARTAAALFTERLQSGHRRMPQFRGSSIHLVVSIVFGLAVTFLAFDIVPHHHQQWCTGRLALAGGSAHGGAIR